MKIIFMGTPIFGMKILEALTSKHEIVLVVTQPDQYNKRKKGLVAPPVKQWALDNGLEVIQPESIKTEVERIKFLDVDLIVTAAYGQFIPTKILNHPRYKSINVHGSLLPKYRGGAPIQRAIINGEDKTGISIIYMGAKMDAGDIIKKEAIDILEVDTQDTIFEKLSVLGSKLVLEAIDEIEQGTVTLEKQNEEEVTFAYNLTKDDEKIDFSKSARDVFNQIRGLNSNPGAYFSLEDLTIKVYNSRVSDYQTDYPPGVIIKINKDSFDVSCKDNTVISILEVQPPSKNRMSVRDYLNGSGKNIIVKNKEIL